MSTATTTESKYGRLKNYINGGFVTSIGGRSLLVHSPLDGSPLAEMPCATAAELDAAVTAARNAFPRWSRTPTIRT